MTESKNVVTKVKPPVVKDPSEVTPPKVQVRSKSKEREEGERMLDDIVKDLMSGGDIGICFSRLIAEVKWNRGEISRIQDELEKMWKKR